MKNQTPEKTITLDIRLWIYEHLFLIMMIIFVPVIYHMIFVFPLTDFVAHRHFIERIYQTRSLIFDGDSVANFLFSILSLIITRLFRLDVSWGMLVVMVGNYLALGYLIVQRIFTKHDYYNPKVILPVVMAVLLYFPIILNPAVDFRNPYGYLPPTSYHNPTVWLAKTFSLWSFFLFFDHYKDKNLKWHTYLLAAVVSICSIISKPNYAMGFLAIAGLMVIYLWIRRESFNFWYMVFGYFIPMVGTLIWQYWLNFIAAPYSTLAVQPFVVAQTLAMNGPLALELILGALFPLVVAVVYWKQALANRTIVFGWLQFAVGLAFYYLFTETGPHQFDGNFIWGAELALFVLIVISLNFWLDIFKQKTRRRLDYLPLVVLLIHGIYGLMYAYHCFTIING